MTGAPSLRLKGVGKMKNHEAGAAFLPSKEIRRRLGAYKQDDEKLLAHLYGVSQMMLGEAERRREAIELKARTLVPWVAAIIGFLLTQIDHLSPLEKFGAVLASLFALTSGVAAFVAQGASKMKWFSDKGWLPDREGADVLTLMRQHIRVLAVINGRNERVNMEKGLWLRLAQLLFLVSVSILAVVTVFRAATGGV